MSRRHFGSVRKLPSGFWQATYKLNGANYRGPKTFRTKADALAYLSTVEADVLRGSWIDPELTETRFHVVAEEWLRSNVNKRDSSLQRDLGILENHVLPVFGNRAIGSIRPANVQSLVDTWASTYSANTTQRHYATLRSIFSFAEASEIILRSPCRGIRLPKIRQTERPVLTTAELLSLADALGLVDGLFMWCGAALGLRWSEIAGLTVDRMDFAARTVTVVLEMPSSSAIAFFGTPSATWRRIYAQFSNVITLPFSGVHFSPASMFSFQAASTTLATCQQCGPTDDAIHNREWFQEN